MRRRALPLLAALALPACAPSISDLASFIGDPFGDITESVQDLNESQIEDLMAELMLRFRLYVELRQALPIDALQSADECFTEVRDTGAAFTFVADTNCVFGQEVDPADGAVAVSQQQLAFNPSVFRFELEYRQVRLGDVTVSGTERITETDTSDGASVRKLDIVQDGIELSYEFRAGLEGGDTPVFDYQLPGPDGDVLARITNPTSTGGFVTVFLTGLDGTLACEVRDSFWEPDRLPRGTCENGIVFGLPEE